MSFQILKHSELLLYLFWTINNSLLERKKNTNKIQFNYLKTKYLVLGKLDLKEKKNLKYFGGNHQKNSVGKQNSHISFLYDPSWTVFPQSHSNVDLRATCCMLSTALNSVLCLAGPAHHTWVPTAQTPVWFLPLQTSSMKWTIHSGRTGTPDLVILIPHGLWHSKAGLPVVTLVGSLVLRIDWNTS